MQHTAIPIPWTRSIAYSDRDHRLAVASITASVSVSTRAGVQLGLGDPGNYAGNLVPFEA